MMNILNDMRTEPEGRAGAVSRSEARDQGKALPPRVVGTTQAPQGMGTAPRLPELQEHLDSTRRDAQGRAVGVSVQG